MDSDSFKELQKEWYKKLKAEGFKDIEHMNTKLVTSCNIRKHHHNYLYSSYYYDLASNFYNDFNWGQLKSNTYKEVWDLFREGKSFNKIGILLNIHPSSVYRRFIYIKKHYFNNYLKEKININEEIKKNRY